MWYELTRWKAYRSVEHKLMNWYIWYLPILAVIVVLVPLVATNRVSQALSTDGIVDSTLSALMLLPGFFFAALAAVATLGSDFLDKNVDEDEFKVPMRTQGKVSLQPLTMRVFLCLLFAYLTAISFIAILLGAFNKAFRVMWSSGEALLQSECFMLLVNVLEASFLSVYVYLIASILIGGAHGLYFLAERIHRPPGV